jgi:hypothetical protein
MSLRGASGVGEVDRGTIEEKIWNELGALPRSRYHRHRKVAEDQVQHNQRQDQTEGRQSKPLLSPLRPPAVAEKRHRVAEDQGADREQINRACDDGA